MKYDIGIIGGGVIGLSCAWRLAQGGARVALFERGEVGREASFAAAGMLAAQCEMAHHPPQTEARDDTASTRAAAMFELCLQSRALYPDFAEELHAATGIDIELSLNGNKRNDWRTPGILYVQTRADDHAPRVLATQQNVAPAPDFSGFPASWLPEEGQVENRLLVQALHAAALNAGVDIFEHTRAGQIWLQALQGWDEREKPRELMCRIRALQIGLPRHNRFAVCENYLFCSGAWSKRLNVPRSCRPTVRPVPGQMISLPNTAKLSHIIYSSDVYLVPRHDGRLLIGATVEKSRFRKEITVEAATQLFEAACRLCPALKGTNITEHWAGLRPGTPDGLPILGKTPMQNLFVATGHYRNGILLAPQTAQIMTRCLLQNEDAPPAFSVERFQ